MIIKVCGMRNADNIKQVSQIKEIDWMGFIFTDKSKRYALAENDFDTNTDKKKVGVFVDATIEDVVEKIEMYNLDIVQLHGEEPSEFVKLLKSRIEDESVKERGGSPLELEAEALANKAAHSLPASRGGAAAHQMIMKAFPVDSSFDFELTKPYEGIVDYFLFDAKGKEAGGNGIQFDWSVLDRYRGETPFLLAGGINPDSVDKIKAFHHDKCVGIDVNSGFEVEPGLKSNNKLNQFVKELCAAVPLWGQGLRSEIKRNV